MVATARIAAQIDLSPTCAHSVLFRRSRISSLNRAYNLWFDASNKVVGMLMYLVANNSSSSKIVVGVSH